MGHKACAIGVAAWLLVAELCSNKQGWFDS